MTEKEDKIKQSTQKYLKVRFNYYEETLVRVSVKNTRLQLSGRP